MKWCSMSKQSILFCTGKTDGYSHYWLLKRKQTARHYYLRNHIHDSIIYNEEIFTCLCVHNFDSFKCALFCCTYWWRLQWWWWRRRRRRHNVFDKNQPIFCTLLMLCIHWNATTARWSYMNSLLCYCFGMLLTSFCIAYARLFWILIHIIFQFVLHIYDSRSTRLQSRRHSQCNIGSLFLLCMWTSEHMCAMRIHILMNSPWCFLTLCTCLSLSLSILLRLAISHEEQKCCWYDMNALAPAKPFITYCT